MTIDGKEENYDVLITINEYLKDKDIYRFTTNLENGYVEYLTDKRGNPIIRTIITLEENDEIFATCDLDFKSFSALYKYN